MGQWMFGDFVMDRGTRELRRNGAAVTLSPKAFELLGLLIDSAPRALSKADIQERLWPGTFVVEKNVTNLVSEIRAALGDTPARPRFVRTVPRWGYAFAGDLAAGANAGPQPPVGWPRHNLPAALTSFVGRADALAELRRILPSTRLLTIAGAGGCGKTRLAIELARRALDEFRDGVWLADLAPLADAAAVARTVASLFEVRHETGRPVEPAIASGLRGQQALLILDNCEHVIEACAALALALLDAAPAVAILATSREPLGIAGETVWRVPSLSMPAEADDEPRHAIDALARHGATALFVERARAVDPAFALTAANAPAVVEICRRLDGIPLAIELAAARLRVLSVQQIRERLHDRFTLLTGGSRTAAARQRTLEAALDWSYTLASDAERLLLRRLAVFARDCTIETAEAVCGGDGLAREDILDLVSRLADKSLVTVDTGPDDERRYRLLEIVRHYARARLLDSGEVEPVCDRHLETCRDLMSRAAAGLAGRDQVVWLRRLLHDYDNLRAALEWSLTSPTRAARGLEIATGLILFWIMRGAFAEGQQWLERLLAATGAPPPALRALALLGLGQIAFFQGRFGEARSQLGESAALARQEGDQASAALALGFEALALLESGDTARGVPLAEEALALRTASPPWVHGPALSFLAYQALDEGDLERAARGFAEVLALGRSGGHRWGTAIALFDLALLRVVQGRHLDAESLCEEAIHLFHELGDRWGIALCLGILAGAEAAAGRARRAAALAGAMQGLLASVNAPVQASFERWIGARHLTHAERELGAEAWRDGLAEGRAMTPARAIACALRPGSHPAGAGPLMPGR